jgi:predicted enzyme related to lactoylglutathione lyase
MTDAEAIANEGVAVVSQNRISAVLCSTDLARSQEFYEQKVGLMLSPETIPNHVLFESADGTSVLIYGRPSPNQADHTQVRFWSTDIERDVRDLLARGVVFEDYDFPTLKTVEHVATTAGIGKSAWFKDPDGNTLALFQPE